MATQRQGMGKSTFPSRRQRWLHLLSSFVANLPLFLNELLEPFWGVSYISGVMYILNGPVKKEGDKSSNVVPPSCCSHLGFFVFAFFIDRPPLWCHLFEFFFAIQLPCRCRICLISDKGGGGHMQSPKCNHLYLMGQTPQSGQPSNLFSLIATTNYFFLSTASKFSVGLLYPCFDCIVQNCPFAGLLVKCKHRLNWLRWNSLRFLAIGIQQCFMKFP